MVEELVSDSRSLSDKEEEFEDLPHNSNNTDESESKEVKTPPQLHPVEESKSPPSF